MNNSYSNFFKNCQRTEPDYDHVVGRVIKPGMLRILHGAMGASTEANELLDAAKKHVFYGKPLDQTNLREEIGDCLWYLAILAHELGDCNFTDIMQTVINKLRVRYPQAFNEQDANVRDLKAERKVLEGQTPV